MKAKELMIFDLIRRKKDGKIMTVVELRYAETIAAITPDDAYYGDMEDYHESEIEPIPLTSEILEKNGFKEIEGKRTSLGQSWVWHEKSEKVYGKYVEITLYDEAICGISSLVQIETCSQIGDGLNKLHSCDIHYVHELQHALRLCGIEKEIMV